MYQGLFCILSNQIIQYYTHIGSSQTKTTGTAKGEIQSEEYSSRFTGKKEILMSRVIVSHGSKSLGRGYKEPPTQAPSSWLRHLHMQSKWIPWRCKGFNSTVNIHLYGAQSADFSIPMFACGKWGEWAGVWKSRTRAKTEKAGRARWSGDIHAVRNWATFH